MKTKATAIVTSGILAASMLQLMPTSVFAA